jgi:hypothetical protein
MNFSMDSNGALKYLPVHQHKTRLHYGMRDSMKRNEIAEAFVARWMELCKMKLASRMNY